MTELNEKLFNEVSQSLKMVFDLTSRIDERIKFLIDSNQASNEKIEKIIERQEAFNSRLSILENKNGVKHEVEQLKQDVKEIELKINTLEINTNIQANKWKLIIDLVFKVVVVVTGGIILWQLGFKN